jgi:hypothetical protein
MTGLLQRQVPAMAAIARVRAGAGSMAYCSWSVRPCFLTANTIDHKPTWPRPPVISP